MSARIPSRPTEYMLAPVPSVLAADGHACEPPHRHSPAVVSLVARYAAEGWTMVAMRAGASAPQVLFRRPLRPSAAAC